MTNSNEDEQKYKTKLFLFVLILVAFLGMILIFMHGGAWSSSDNITVIISALAAMSVGALVGFLFGIPKTKKDKQSNDSDSSVDSPYSPNTSLEEISDWLTKIIIGVGLVELKDIGASLKNLAELIANSMTDADVIKHTPFVLAFIVFYLILGFFISFLTTSFFLREILSEAERRLKRQMKDIRNDLTHILSEIRRHTSIESLVAQSDFWREEGENKEANPDPEKRQNFLERSLNGYMRAIAIDQNNIPAHIGLAKYHAAFKRYKDAREELNSLKNKLNNTQWSDEDGSYSKTMGRIEYNIACYYFKDGKLNSNKGYIEKAFKLLQEATTKEPLYKGYAKLDNDWDGMDQTEKDIFERIVGR